MNSSYSSSSSSSSSKEHHYAIDAASLLSQCRKNLRFIIEQQKEDRVNDNVLDLERTLLTTEQLLHFHLLTLLEQERHNNYDKNGTGNENRTESGNGRSGSVTDNPRTSTQDDLDSSNHAITLEPIMHTVEELQKVLRQRNQRQRSLSFLNWHHHQTQQDQQQLQGTTSSSPTITSGADKNKVISRDSRGNRGHQRSLLRSKHYSKALRDAQKNIGKTININHNVVDTHFPPSSIAYSSSIPATESSRLSSASSSPSSYADTTTSNMVMKPMEKSALDSILFRLIVALQLCLVRIEEAEHLLCPKASPKAKKYDTSSGSGSGNEHNNHIVYDNKDKNKNHSTSCNNKHSNNKSRINLVWMTTTTLAVCCTSTYLLTKDKIQWNKIHTTSNIFKNKDLQLSILKSSTKALVLTSTSLYLRRGWRMLTMNARLLNTIFAIEELHQQWMLVHSVQMGNSKHEMGSSSDRSSDQQCKHLLKLMSLRKSTSSIWESQGAFRYGLIKWGMDLLYASVGASLKVNKQRKNSIMVPLTAAAAASYYAITGPSDKSAEFISSDSSDLIRNAWGVVSLPAVKTLSLQASRLLKGAAIAERINICGVSCFILSKKPFPVLSTAIKRYRRQQKRNNFNLSTILEYEEFSYSQRAVNLNEYPRKDVIFHLTGGGFFAHTLAGDVPFLLDWSFATSAIVICPEYALLPENPFPAAIDEITRVYSSLVNGNSSSLLGFQVNKIIVTGESTGGNLAAALCVKLCLDGLVDVEALTAERRFLQARVDTIPSSEPLSPSSTMSENDESSASGNSSTYEESSGMIRLPNALMLCCPALNLSLELSPSRVLTKDAVLPSSLISTISDAYVPSKLHISKRDPIVSPYFAPDECLRIFPPTLLYASSEDPLLDDSVHFNTRLKANGAECDLRAAQNLPHAYLGLGTAGFPEARQVQRECEHWMVKHLVDT